MHLPNHSQFVKYIKTHTCSNLPLIIANFPMLTPISLLFISIPSATTMSSCRGKPALSPKSTPFTHRPLVTHSHNTSNSAFHLGRSFPFNSKPSLAIGKFKTTISAISFHTLIESSFEFLSSHYLPPIIADNLTTDTKERKSMC